MENEETLNEKNENTEIQEENKNNKLKQNKDQKQIVIAIIIAFVSFLFAFILAFSSCSSRLEEKQTAKGYILKYCNLSYPDTFKLKTCYCDKESYEEDGYEIWEFSGYFTCENTFGMEMNNNYKIYLKVSLNYGSDTLLWLVVDNETYYGSEQALWDLNPGYCVIKNI